MYLKTFQYKEYDNLEIKESMFNKFDLPKHINDCYCIALQKTGVKYCTIEANEHLIPSNSVSIINPNQVHADKNIDNQNCLNRMIYINKDVINHFLKKKSYSNSRHQFFK